MKKYSVSLYRELAVRVYYETEVEAENAEEAEDKAADEAYSLPLSAHDIRDCVYSNDEVKEIK